MCRSNRNSCLLIVFLFPTHYHVTQGREPAESQLYAKHDRGPNRVGPVVLRVPPSPPTANLQIIFSVAAETREHWSEHVRQCTCASMYVYGVRVCMRVSETTLKVASWSFFSCGPPYLWGGEKPELNLTRGISPIKSCDEDVTNNWFWCLLGTFEPCWRNKKSRMIIVSMIEWISVYSHRTMLSNWGSAQKQCRKTDVWSVCVWKKHSLY